MARRKQPTIPDDLLEQLLAGADAKTAFAKALRKRLAPAQLHHSQGRDRISGREAASHMALASCASDLLPRRTKGLT